MVKSQSSNRATDALNSLITSFLYIYIRFYLSDAAELDKEPDTDNANPQDDPPFIDWDTWAHTPGPDQSSKLPDRTTFSLVKLETKLVNPDRFNTWYQEIEKSLRDVNCQALISDAIPRPRVRNITKKAENWFYLSKKVKQWIASSIDDTFFVEIECHCGECEFADDFMKDVKLMCELLCHQDETSSVY